MLIDKYKRRLILVSSSSKILSTTNSAEAEVVERLVVSDGHMLLSDKIRTRCAIGHGGLKRNKIEGDGATPIGQFPLRQLLFRPDRVSSINTGLPTIALERDDGWCDDQADPNYNKKVKLPYKGHCENLWRNDHIYDLIVVIGYNDMPIIMGSGSAIFLHVAQTSFRPTNGCISIELQALLNVIQRCTSSTVIDIQPNKRG